MAAAQQLPNSMAFSSFGADNTTQGAPAGGFARAILESVRYRTLDRRQSYYDATQHNGKRYDFDGRIISTSEASGMSSTQPLLSQEKASWYVPLRMRRPNAPYRLARVIVNAFTNMIFGEQRFPTIRVDGDDVRQDFVQAIVRASSLPVRAIQARNLGGSVGSSAMSWRFADGKPLVEVHNGKNVIVHEWADRVQLIPAFASEVYLFPKDEWDPQKKIFARNWYWYRRDWSTEEDLLFKPVIFKQGTEPNWQVDDSGSSKHKDGICHLEWIQNLPCDDIDGLPDYDSLYDKFDSIDILYSTITRGATLNLDPTLKLKMDLDYVQRMGVKKGSDNALVTGKDGDANYMELSGTSIDAGIRLFDSMRRSALEVAQCIVPDPSEVAAQGVSSVALKAMYAPMLGKCAVLREQYGTSMSRMLDNMVKVAAKRTGQPVTIKDDEGNEVEAAFEVKLPPKVMTVPVLDAEGNPTDETRKKVTDRTPGVVGEVDLQWGAYFLPTPADQAQTVAALSQATGGKAFLSKQSAAEITAGVYNLSPTEEWQRVQDHHAEEEAKALSMFGDQTGDMGGQVTHTTELPNGATVRKTGTIGGAPPMGEEEAPAPGPTHPGDGISLSPTDTAAVVTVNEARASIGLPPCADGELTIAEFKAKRAQTIAQAANADAGKVGEPPKADTPKPSPFGGGKPPFGKGGKPFGGGPKLPAHLTDEVGDEDE